MKSAALFTLAIVLSLAFNATASAQQFGRDYIAFEGSHQTLPNVRSLYILVNSTVPAHLGRDRDGFLLVIAFDQNGKGIESETGEYKLRGTPATLTAYFNNGVIETGQFDENQYRILSHSRDQEQVGKAIAISPKRLEGRLKELNDDWIRQVRHTEAYAATSSTMGSVLRKCNDKFAEKIGL